MADSSPARPRGRPRTFDRRQALDRAMLLFWEQGYDGTSMQELVEVLGLSASSIYGAFGSKEQLFTEVIDHYLAGPGGYFAPLLEAEGTVQAAFHRLFERIPLEMTRRDLPAGCLVSIAATQAASSNGEIHDLLRARRTRSRDYFVARLQRGLAAGELPGGTDVARLGQFLITIIQGMAVQARDGATVEELLAVGRTAVRSVLPLKRGKAPGRGNP